MNSWNNTMPSLLFALRALRREWRVPELRLLGAALVLAVTALSAVGFFTDRMRQAMHLQAAELIGSDLVVHASRPLPPQIEALARQHGLRSTPTLQFSSMAQAGDEFALVAVKAVTEGYPLRGALRTSPRLDTADAVTQDIPAAGAFWAEPSLLVDNEIDSGALLGLGDLQLPVRRVLTREPERSGDVFQVAPRILMNLEDIPRSGLLGEGSRATYSLLLAGDKAALDAFQAALEPFRDNTWHMHAADDSSPAVRSAIEQAQRFLNLAALSVVILAGAAVAVAARRFARSQADTGAVLRCLGASQHFVLAVYLWHMLFIALAAAALGCVFGYGLQEVLSELLGRLFVSELPAPGWQPVALGFATALVTLFGFALPALLRIKDIPPLRVLRQDVGEIPPSLWQTALLAAVGLALLLRWQAGDNTLALIILGGVVGALALLGAAGWAMLRGLRVFRGRAGVAWRFGLANLMRRGGTSVLQLAGFGLGLMALLLLAVVRVDLLDTWQTSLRDDTPNHFVLNIQTGELEPFRQRLREAGIDSAIYPMVPGSLLTINGTPVDPDAYESPRAQRMARRAANLSFARDLPAHNSLVAGEWWNGPAQCSMERGLAETLKIELGDELEFQAGAQRFRVTVTSLREVEWDSFKVNFFFVLSPDVFESVPYTYITSFHLDDAHRTLRRELVRTFPGISIIDVRHVLEHVKTIMARAVLAVEFVFSLTLVGGILVLYAAIQASREERLHEGAVLRTLGAGRKQVLAALLAEFMTLGALAGLLAALCASLIGYALAVQVFELPYYFNPWLWLLGVGGGALGVGLAGFLGTARWLRQPLRLR